MKTHQVVMHCGQLMPASSPHQRFCNRQCAGYYVSRRPGAKKRNRNLAKQDLPRPSRNLCCVESNDPAWNRARRYVNKRGYVILSLYDPDLKLSFQRLEHIIIWEKFTGERLPLGWVIHHINEQRDDNEPGNLMALSRGVHKELHAELQQLKAACTGFEYMVRRHQLTQEYAARATRLTELRSRWFA